MWSNDIPQTLLYTKYAISTRRVPAAEEKKKILWHADNSTGGRFMVCVFYWGGQMFKHNGGDLSQPSSLEQSSYETCLDILTFIVWATSGHGEKNYLQD